MFWNYTQPVTIRFGNGRISELGKEIIGLGGSKGILITSRSFEKRGFIQKIIDDSNNLIKVAYSQVSPNPDITECEDCVKLIRDNQCDFVVALGGGSVLDCAKAAAVFAKGTLPSATYMDDISKLPTTRLPFIAVPTTAGTGSEISSVTVLSDHVKGVKKPLAGPAFYPDLAIIDPELTLTLPRDITAATGMDVLCHAIEGYWSRNHLPICDALAVHAIRTTLNNLRTACDQPDNLEARERMAEASVIAGLAFTVPRTTSSHACSYPLTNDLGIPHGEACALTIDYFMRINARGDADGRLQALAAMLGYASALELADAITQLKKDIGIMTDLKQFNLTDDQIEMLVKGSQNPILKLNPVEITEEMLREMYLSFR